MDTDDRYTRITLRIPKDLHQQLADVAEATSKSMNAEIVARLRESFATPQPREQSQFGEWLNEWGYEGPSDAAKTWADRMVEPGRRDELEELLKLVLHMLARKP